MKNKYLAIFSLILFMVVPLSAGERTIPVDIFLMIDKSISMSEAGRFEDLQNWVQNHLFGEIMIDGDWLTVYQFYGKCDNLLTVTVNGKTEREQIAHTLSSIKPDGKFTDIGLALDTIKLALDNRASSERFKILMVLTDMKQEAPWTSLYAGSPEKFDSPYLSEARIINHNGWYEITLGMNIRSSVDKTSKELFSTLQKMKGKPLELSDVIGFEDESSDGESGNHTTAKKTGFLAQSGTLPLFIIFVILLVLISAGIVIFLFILGKRKKERQEDEENTKKQVK